MYHIFLALLKKLLHFVSSARHCVPLVDASLPFLLLGKGHLLKLWDVGWKHIICYLCISCFISSLFARHSKQYSKHYCSSFFVELKPPSFSWYREETAQKNSFLRSLSMYLSPVPSQTSPREVKLNCCLENCCQNKWMNESPERSWKCCCFSSGSLHSPARWLLVFPGSYLKAQEISLPPPSHKLQ